VSDKARGRRRELGWDPCSSLRSPYGALKQLQKLRGSNRLCRRLRHCDALLLRSFRRGMIWLSESWAGLALSCHALQMGFQGEKAAAWSVEVPRPGTAACCEPCWGRLRCRSAGRAWARVIPALVSSGFPKPTTLAASPAPTTVPTWA